MTHLLTLLLARLGIADLAHVDTQDAGLALDIAQLRVDLDRLKPRVDEFVLEAPKARDAS